MKKHSYILLVFLLVFSCVKEAPVMYTLTIGTSDGGTVSPNGGVYEEGSTVKLTAIPGERWEFVEWTGDYEGVENPIEIILNQPKEIFAKFSLGCELDIVEQPNYYNPSYSLDKI